MVSGGCTAPDESLGLDLHGKNRGSEHSIEEDTAAKKNELLRKIPFSDKLLNAKKTIQKNNQGEEADWMHRLFDIMETVHFQKGDQLADKKAACETMYIIKEGTVEITYIANKQYILGPGDYIGAKGLMGSGEKEPTVPILEALDDGSMYTIKKTLVDKELGKNFFVRENAKLTDVNKLHEFQCMKGVHPDALETTKDQITMT